MNRFMIQAFFEAFPFLTAGDNPIVCKVSDVEEVAVSRIDKDFLDKTPQYYGTTGSLVGIHDSENIYLFNQDGTLLVVVKQSGDIHHNEAHMDNESWYGETVGEALLRTDPAQVHYAVMVHTGYVIQNHYSEGGYSVTVYKSPAGFTLPEWVEEQKRRASEQISATISKIDAEAMAPLFS